MPFLTPFESAQTAFPLTVPHAFRAWAQWCNEQGYGGLQVRDVHEAAERTAAPAPAVLLALCEVYSRAIMEVAIGLHFSRVDSRVDQLVLQHVSDLFGPDVASSVAARVSERGPLAATQRLEAEAEQTVPRLPPEL